VTAWRVINMSLRCGGSVRWRGRAAGPAAPTPAISLGLGPMPKEDLIT
jgi:hypothetical protein